MANIKSAKKRIETSNKARVSNNELQKSMRTAIKNVEKAVLTGNKKDATSKLDLAFKKLDKTAKAGIIKANKVSRNKSRLAKKVNELK